MRFEDIVIRRFGEFERRLAAIERRLDENLLQTLIERALLPRYAFPTDTVSFWVARPRGAGGCHNCCHDA